MLSIARGSSEDKVSFTFIFQGSTNGIKPAKCHSFEVFNSSNKVTLNNAL